VYTIALKFEIILVLSGEREVLEKKFISKIKLKKD
tara:strand:+ start:11 stop:115 length:105 start_codon:yes stop_codon:yes gene_type:complete